MPRTAGRDFLFPCLFAQRWSFVDFYTPRSFSTKVSWCFQQEVCAVGYIRLICVGAQGGYTLLKRQLLVSHLFVTKMTSAPTDEKNPGQAVGLKKQIGLVSACAIIVGEWCVSLQLCYYQSVSLIILSNSHSEPLMAVAVEGSLLSVDEKWIHSFMWRILID